MYFCHNCCRFHNLPDPSAPPERCAVCDSPLVEAVRSASQRRELELLARPQQPEPVGIIVRHRAGLAGLLPDIFGRLLAELSGDDARPSPAACLPVDEMMRSFATFPAGLRGGGGPPVEPLGGTCCAICRDDVADCAAAVVVLPCRHCFHSDCMRPWLRERAVCPVCRVSLLPAHDADEGS